MKFLAIATLVLGCAAAPAPEEERPRPRKGLLTIIGFFTAPRCNKTQEGWLLSTGIEQWPYMRQFEGCQTVNEDWDIASVQVAWLGKKCSVSIFTDTKCKENGVTPVFETCSTNGDKWKSFSISGCAEIAAYEAEQKKEP